MFSSVRLYLPSDLCNDVNTVSQQNLDNLNEYGKNVSVYLKQLVRNRLMI